MLILVLLHHGHGDMHNRGEDYSLMFPDKHLLYNTFTSVGNVSVERKRY